jgi:hypothetical protein
MILLADFQFGVSVMCIAVLVKKKRANAVLVHPSNGKVKIISPKIPIVHLRVTFRLKWLYMLYLGN